MWEAEIITSWAGSGIPTDKNRPQLIGDYSLVNFEDVTAQPSENLHPDPSIYIVKVLLEGSVLGDIQTDNNYYINWAEEIIEESI